MTHPTSSSDPLHFPVMLDEVVKICSPNKGGVYIDCTFGGGGYSKKLLKFSKTKVIALDRDEFKQMVKRIRNVEKSIGSVNYSITKSAMKNYYSRRSLYVSRPIKKGEIIK